MADEEKKQEIISIDLSAYKIEAPKDKKALKINANFKAFIKGLGPIDLDREDQTTVSTLLPEGFSSEKLTTALNLYADSYSSYQLEEKVDNYVEQNPELEEDARYSLYAETYLVRVFERAKLKENRSLQRQINNLLTQEQIAEYSQIPAQTSINFQIKGEVFQPIIKKTVGFLKGAAKEGAEELKGFLGGVAKDKAKKLIGKFAKRAIRKVGKKLAKKAIKTGVGIALKAGVQAAGLAAPGIGTVVATILTEALPRLARFIKSLGMSLVNWIRKNKEKFAAAAVVALSFGVVVGSPIIILGGIVMGAMALSIGGFSALLFGIWGAFILPMVTMAIGAFAAFLFAVIFLTAIVYLVITSGAYIVPPGGFSPRGIVDTPGGPGEGRSQYIGLEKKTNVADNTIANSELPKTATYTITITAKKGTLSNISYTNTYTVSQEPKVATPPNPSLPAPPDTISPTHPFTFGYTVNFNSSFADSVVCDTFTVSAELPDGTTDSVTVSLCVTIGTPPEDCPAGWPVATGGGQEYFINQGPFGQITHFDDDAIDVHPWENGTPNIVTPADRVIATHRGEVTAAGVGRYGGLYVDILGTCGGEKFRSRHVHFSFISTSKGAQVARGTVLGAMGSTGWAAVPHNHYEFMDDTSAFNPPILMGAPYIPVPRSQIYGCGSHIACNVCINFSCPW